MLHEQVLTSGPHATDHDEPRQDRKVAAVSCWCGCPGITWIELVGVGASSKRAVKQGCTALYFKMSYEVIARKWRPQAFEDLVGQEHVVRTLVNAVESDRIAHAYIFVGPRGIGKTSVARIFAKALNCEQGPTASPCNQCDLCREIMQGHSMDVIEIDGASNNGVDQIRDLRETAQYTAAKSRFKIYIIDEVHMLSTAAFNALLKTLEEPPDHVKFMFATTEVHKVPATILSRCQRFELRKISTRDIMDRLKLITKAEKVKIDDAALMAIARGADGGLRDAQSALDQIIAFQGKKISEEDVLSVFGLVSWKAIEDISNAILDADVSTIIRCVDELDRNGKDTLRLVLELIEHFRNLLILMHADADTAFPDLTDAQLDTLKQQKEKTEPGQVLQIVQLLTDVETRVRHAISRRTLLEVTLIRCSRAAKVVSLDRLIKDVQALQEGMESTEVPSAASAEPPPAARPQAPAEKKTADLGTEFLSEHWAEISERCAHMAPRIKHLLKDAKPVSLEENRLVIGFDPEFESDLEQIRQGRNPAAVAKTFSDFIGRPLKVQFILLDASVTLPGDMKFPSEQDAELDEKRSRSRAEWMQEPLVRQTLEVFDGMISDIRE